MIRDLFRRPSGRILGVRLGLNPNSSSLGADITFLLFGLSAVTVVTPILGFLLRFSCREKDPSLSK
ncbi:MAG TPA: hypothetical protein PKE31_13965 [Pseudomonadota bacterium]|jgi:hypothetical protein|nr:hypothetical protein [Pseudomonadota bacterium]